MPTDYAMLSTYPPTQCGLATFSAALLTHLPVPGDNVGVVRVLDEPAPQNSPLIAGHLINGSAARAADAIGIINGFDVAIVQHEYGIYGGPDGQQVIPLLDALDVPSIVVLHTVLADPTRRQRMVLHEVIAAADMVVTMTQTGRSRVLESYGTSPGKVSVVPHGAAGTLAARSASRRQAGGPRGLTWGQRGKAGLHRGRPDSSAGAGAHRRGLPPVAAGTGGGPWRRRLRAFRRPVPAGQRTGRSRRHGRRRAAAVRLPGAGHVRGADRGNHGGEAGDLDPVPARRRTAQRRCWPARRA